jgi:hypothetical protein
MDNVYVLERDRHLKLFEEIDADPVINGALDFSLPNNGEETDYEGWLEGAKRFADDNYDLLREWVR